MASLRSSSFLTRLADPFAPTVGVHPESQVRLPGSSRPWLIPLAAGLVLLALSIVGWVVDPQRFYFSYLVAWLFCTSIALGALFFVITHHIVKAHWGIVVRRIAEAMAMSFPALLVLSIPIWFGMHDLFKWTHPELYVVGTPEYDPIIAAKEAYLNVPFFVLRVVFYFLAWSFLSYKLWKLSVSQDLDPEADIPFKQRRTAAWGIPLFAVTVAFASYDLIMSLDSHWFSTIFGVYFFAGAFWSGVAFICIAAILLQRMGVLRGVVSTEHYHDLGKWMFAFTVFWAYIAFSQYMLIWYANLKETTIWYAHRMEHGWEYHSAALLIMHFILPFFILLPRAAKRSTVLLSVMAVWILIMQWFDLHWLMMPIYDYLYGGHAGFYVWDLTTWLGLFGIIVALFMFRLGRHSLVPVNDPRLGKSLTFHNI
jgi:hypothetical protein